MKNLTIKFVPEADPWCAECGKPLHAGDGPQMYADEEAVCRECGKKHAPHVVALVDLAHVADRVGKVCRHALVPPMEALLALARAAEDFNHHTPRLLRKTPQLLKKAG
jgi:hypothetical protein